MRAICICHPTAHMGTGFTSAHDELQTKSCTADGDCSRISDIWHRIGHLVSLDRFVMCLHDVKRQHRVENRPLRYGCTHFSDLRGPSTTPSNSKLKARETGDSKHFMSLTTFIKMGPLLTNVLRKLPSLWQLSSCIICRSHSDHLAVSVAAC